MTPKEFKAWFEGFTEAFAGCPTKAQWTRIKERVAEINGNPVTEYRYWHHYWPTYQPATLPIIPYWNTCNGIEMSNATSLAQAQTCNQVALNGSSFNASSAMYALGKADAQNVAA